MESCLGLGVCMLLQISIYGSASACVYDDAFAFGAALFTITSIYSEEAPLRVRPYLSEVRPLRYTTLLVQTLVTSLRLS
jgi:hypothetical protein